MAGYWVRIVPGCGRGEQGEDGAATRRAVLRGAAVGGASLVASSVLAPVSASSAAGSPAQDTRILNLVLRLEYTEEAFYAEAVRNGKLKGELLRFATTAAAHERAHLAFLRRALGSNAVAQPRFHFGRATSDPTLFVTTATKLEDLAVAGYNGQATNLSAGALAAAATIVSVEARHAAWIRAITGVVAAPEPIDKPISATELEHGLRRIGLRG